MTLCTANGMALATRTRTAIVQIRTSPEVKAKIEAMAAQDAMSVTAFLTALVNAEAKKRRLVLPETP